MPRSILSWAGSSDGSGDGCEERTPLLKASSSSPPVRREAAGRTRTTTVRVGAGAGCAEAAAASSYDFSNDESTPLLLDSCCGGKTSDPASWRFSPSAYNAAGRSSGYGSVLHSRRASSNPEYGAFLAWKELTLFVPTKPVRKTPSMPAKPSLNLKLVLNGATGYVKPGTLLAVIGASGAGKTSLINALTGRTPTNCQLDGQVFLNGRLCSQREMAYYSGFVHQSDLFFPSLTVKEHLIFSATLRVGRTTTTAEIHRRVSDLIQVLGLSKCRNTLIGDKKAVDNGGISGGERKRLAFATEILTDPPLLFCDEPTSGLDSFNAAKVVHMMRGLTAQLGKTVVCTIHQPTSEVFAMFDSVLLLAEGQTAYLGSTTGALKFLETMGLTCPPRFNPADFFVQTLAVVPGNEAQSRDLIRKICSRFNSSDDGHMVRKIVQGQYALATDFIEDEKEALDSVSVETSCEMFTARNRRARPLAQFTTLLRRSTLDASRNPQIHKLRTIQKVILGFLVGLIFSGFTMNQLGIQNLSGAIFAIVAENTFWSLFGVMGSVPLELPIIFREYQSGLFDAGPYYLAKALSLIPGFLVEPFLFTVIVYSLIGLRFGLYRFLQALFAVFLTANAASACGFMFGTAFESTSVAIATLLPFDVTLMIFGGFFIRLMSVPSVLSWIQWISWFRYSNEALMISQLQGLRNITCEAGVSDDNCITSGDEVLYSYGFSPNVYLWDLSMLFIIYLIFHVLSFLAFYRRARKIAG